MEEFKEEPMPNAFVLKKSLLAQKREEVGLTQAELGEILGRSDQTISNWESGKYACRLSILEVKKLCLAFGWESIHDLPNKLGPDI